MNLKGCSGVVEDVLYLRGEEGSTVDLAWYVPVGLVALIGRSTVVLWYLALPYRRPRPAESSL